MINSIVNEVKFPDVQVKKYRINVISLKMLSQVDSEEIKKMIMEYILYHMKDTALVLRKSELYVATKRVKQRLRKSTVG